MEQHTLHKVLTDKLIKLEEITDSDVISYTGPISQNIKKLFKNFIEDLKLNKDSDVKEYYDILSHVSPNKNEHFLHSRKFI